MALLGNHIIAIAPVTNHQASFKHQFENQPEELTIINDIVRFRAFQKSKLFFIKNSIKISDKIVQKSFQKYVF